MGLRVRKSTAPPPPGCPMQSCMKLVSGAWTPEVVWKQSGGPRRFGELRRDIARISYTLSELVRELLPVINAIVKIGTRLTEAGQREGRRAA
jgi:DNA-binding HxlR family transcriptional regulator